MNDLAEQSVAQIGVLTQTEKDHAGSDAKLKLLHLNADTEKELQKKNDEETALLLAALLLMDANQLRNSRVQIAESLRLTVSRLEQIISSKTAEAAQHGLDSGFKPLTGLVGIAALESLRRELERLPEDAALAVLQHGARGMPLGEALRKYGTDVALLMSARIQRGVVTGEPVSTMIYDLRSLLTGARREGARQLTTRGSFISKVAAESRLTLYTAFNAALERMQERLSPAMELVWSTSPSYDPGNCRHEPHQCGHYEGMTLEQAANEGGTIPLGANCKCSWVARYDVEKLQTQLGL